jgi:Plasmid pRiA4b ORF-3-like protein
VAKKKPAKPETTTEFLRKILSKNPDLDYQQVNRRWAKTDHAGEISNALYYQVRAKLGIKTEWVRVREPEPQSRAKPAETMGEVYQFKITLLETKPPVWRRIQVEDCILDEFHEHIQTAMGWTNSHLHHFKIGGRRYGDPVLLAETFEEMNYSDSTRTRLSDILRQSGERFHFEYVYDFGDFWQHEVLFEGCLRAERRRYPLCVEGKRACPPEDVGGTSGYAGFLVSIADPDDDRYQERLEWIGGSFDPVAFDPVKVSRRMRRGLPDWRQMA